MTAANSCSNLEFSLAWLWLMTGGLLPAGDVHNSPSVLWQYPCMMLQLEYFVGCQQLASAEWQVNAWFSWGLLNNCVWPWPWTVGETLSRVWPSQISATSQSWHWSLCFLYLHIIIGLLLLPPVTETPNFWVPDYIKSPLHWVESQNLQLTTELLTKILNLLFNLWHDIFHPSV
jgi:hypothetical protein